MNAKSILLAALVALGTISFPETADARPRKYSQRHYRAYPQYYHQHYRSYPRYYYHTPRRYYRPNYYYYDPYRYNRRGTYFNFQYGPLSVRGWR